MHGYSKRRYKQNKLNHFKERNEVLEFEVKTYTVCKI